MNATQRSASLPGGFCGGYPVHQWFEGLLHVGTVRAGGVESCEDGGIFAFMDDADMVVSDVPASAPVQRSRAVADCRWQLMQVIRTRVEAGNEGFSEAPVSQVARVGAWAGGRG